MSNTRRCARCAAPLSRSGSRGRWPKYCSDECRNLTYYGRAVTTAVPQVRDCQGCRVPLPPPMKFERNPRKWCSEGCRARTIRQTSAAYRESQARRAAARHRATYVPTEHTLTCGVCSGKFTAKRSDTKYCSTKCRYRQGYLGRRGRHRGAERESYTLADVGDRDQWICGLCTDTVDRALAYPHLRSPSIDHVVPLARGGSDRFDNVQIAHLDCNRRKGARIAA